ncbi:metallophosphoesterase 1 isoform X3 [Muntiacus reevesi]
MFLADTHLLGAVRGHWLDKLRREWQMERAFQTALWLLQPEVVFILGDVFDEGKWSSPKAWADDVGRFWKVFRHPPHVQLWAVAGNHDIGFHYQMDTYRIKRFEKVFSPERLFSWKGINFVMVNSVALEGDGCDICSRAEAELLEISHWLNCSQEEHRPHGCGDRQRLPASAPILLQHFPLYRKNDANCSGEDAAPPDEKYTLFKERYDVLSQEVSRKLLWWLRPRLVLSGHTHSACEVQHGAGILEVSVPSFSWRNRNNPSFIMGWKELKIRPGRKSFSSSQSLGGTHFHTGYRQRGGGRGKKSKNKQKGPHQPKKILHSEGNHQQNKKMAYQMGGGICKSCV